MPKNQTITASDFAFISDLIRKHSGIVLTSDKEYLLQSRLRAALPSMNMGSIQELIELLRHGPTTHLLNKIYDAITINETSFFRDQPVYDHLRNQVLPELAKNATNRPLRIWSAAASTGQEAYSIALLLKGMGITSYDIQGTDLSQRAIERARTGVYSNFEVQRGVRDETLKRFFTPLADGNWQIQDDIRRSVQFRQMNLIQPSYCMGSFDLILCRNVLIYFDEPTKSHILTQLSACLLPNSYLVLGSTESLFGRTTQLKPVKDMPAFFTKA